MKRLIAALCSVGAAGALVVLTLGGSAFAGKQGGNPIGDAAKGKVRAARINAGGVTRVLPFISAGTIAAAAAVPNADERFDAADAGSVTSDQQIGSADLGGGEGTLGCSKRRTAGNVRVNQDCSFRRQAEEDIIASAADPRNLLAGQNDSRMGFNQCWIDFSTDGGRHWGEVAPPFRQHLNLPELDGIHTITGMPGTSHTYDADSDPVVAFDSQGRGFFSCVAFDVASNASMIWVTNSPKGADGALFFNVPITGPRFIVAEDNDPQVAHDKEWIAADHFASSPNRDNVYVTWTVFKFNADGSYQQSPIYGSMSTDHARTWSKPQEISGVAPGLCFFGDLLGGSNPSACDFDQGASPVVLPNGDLEVVFNNGNTPAGNPNGQQLGIHCHPTGDSVAGTANLNCGTPVKVGDDVIVGEPQCNFGRGPEECVPGPFIRTNDFPRIQRNAADSNTLYAVWQDYRGGEYDVQMSRSTDGGAHWSAATTVNPDTGLDHYMAAVDIRPDNASSVGASYYRSERVPNENTTPAGGFAPGMPGVQASSSDYVLAGGTSQNTPFDFRVVSPVFPPPDGAQAGFNGDYSSLVLTGDRANPIWSDTRNADPFAPANGVTNDEDIFTDQLNLPGGRPHTGTGRIGRG
jgi:hypothetical protein